MQSWGYFPVYEDRYTEYAPTKSGVIGMIAAALGIGRETGSEELRGKGIPTLETLSKLKFGIRVDQVGEVQEEWQTANRKEEGWSKTKIAEHRFISRRYFLHDAVFLAGLEGDSNLLQIAKSALESPMFLLGLGRRSCAPELPIVLETVDDSLFSALVHKEWQAKEWYKRTKPEALILETVYEVPFGTKGSYEVRDVPISFSQKHRTHASRFVCYDAETCKIQNDCPKTVIHKTERESIHVKVHDYHDPLSFALDAIDAIDKEEVDVYI
jgi:CRISPR system Cascade subunit CasD